MTYIDKAVEDKVVYKGEGKDGVFFIVKDVDFYTMQQYDKEEPERNKVEFYFHNGNV